MFNVNDKVVIVAGNPTDTDGCRVMTGYVVDASAGFIGTIYKLETPIGVLTGISCTAGGKNYIYSTSWSDKCEPVGEIIADNITSSKEVMDIVASTEV